MTMCSYGNCEEQVGPKSAFKCAVTMSYSGRVDDRKAFCCLEHSWRWLKEYDERLNGKWGPGSTHKEAVS